MQLTMARSREMKQVKEVHGQDEVGRFLESLGFVEGESVTVISELGGNLIVNGKDTRVAWSKSMAGKIMV